MHGVINSCSPCLSHLLKPAPTGPPQEVTAIITDKGEVLVQWAPPLEYRQNGYIDKYSILLTDKETGEERETFVDSFLFQYNIRSLLLSGHFYSLRVRGHNSDGYGPYSEALAVSKGKNKMYI